MVLNFVISISRIYISRYSVARVFYARRDAADRGEYRQAAGRLEPKRSTRNSAARLLVGQYGLLVANVIELCAKP
jgi:hypothetical protein